MGFFRRVKTAIVDFEGYQNFISENLSKAIKYFLMITLIFSIIITICITIPFINLIMQFFEYVKNDMPNFSIKDNVLVLESEEPAIFKNDDLSLFIYVYPKLDKEKIDEIYIENKEFKNGVIFAENQFFVKLEATAASISYDYNTILDSLRTDEITKQWVENYYNSSGYINLFIGLILFVLLYMFLTYIIVNLSNSLILAVLSFITAKIYKVNLNYKKSFILSIYALTLPILLNILYVLINNFTGFQIEYFQVMYNIISYIYIVTVILMMRTDLNKTGSDLIKIEEEVKKEKEEISIDESYEKEDKKKKEEKSAEKNKGKKKKKDDGTPEPTPGKA